MTVWRSHKRIILHKRRQARRKIKRLNFKKMGKIKKKKGQVRNISEITVINHYAGGIDVSDTEMMVAYPIDSKQLVVEPFGCFTCDLKEIVETLKKHDITSVAMESTGVYWVSLFLLLQENGIEVSLVNAKHVKNVTGRKDDEGDAEWIQKLHRCGLLQASFQPDNMTRTLRSMMRHRKSLVQTSSSFINRMQKALELMNIKLHTVISDIDGKTGLSIIKAILGGERRPEVLAELRDKRIKATKEEIIKSLEGYWIKEHLFELRQSYELYLILKEKINECDREIEKQLLEQIASKNDGIIPDFSRTKIQRKPSGKSRLPFNATLYLQNLLGVDVTKIFGINELSALAIVSEVGTDMSKWKTSGHFTSWLGSAPNTKISGGKIISSKIMRKKHHAGQAFRMAAQGLTNSKGPMAEFYKRIKAKAGPGKAIIATARKLAVIWYNMIANQQAFNPKLLEDYQHKHKEKQINYLKRKLQSLEAA